MVSRDIYFFNLKMRFEKKQQTLTWAGLLIVTLFYLLLRWRRLTDSCLMFDEIFSVHAATHSWNGLFQFVAEDLIHPPLFYVLLKIWILAGGESLFWVRLFPLVFSVLAIAPFLLLCRELKLKSTEMLPAFVFLAVNGALIHYSQEVRMYSLLFCFALLSIWLFVKFFESRCSVVSVSIALFIANLLLIYTHYFGWLLIAAEITAVIALKPQKFRQFLASVAGLVLCFLPWGWAVWQVAPTTGQLAQNIGWQSKPGLLKLSQFFLTLNEPFYYQQSSIDPANIWPVALPVTLICVTAIGWCFARCDKPTESSIEDSEITAKQVASLLGIFTAIPLIIAFLASWLLPFSIWGVRHLIIIFASFALLAAIAINRLPVKKVKIAALSLIGAFIIIAGIREFTHAPQTFIWCGWRELAAQAEKQTKEPTTIYVFEDDGAYQLWYWVKNNPNFKIVLINGYADLPKDEAFFLPRSFDEVRVADKTVITGDKFYLAFRETAWKPDKQVLQDLQTRGYNIGKPLEFTAQGVTIFLLQVERPTG